MTDNEMKKRMIERLKSDDFGMAHKDEIPMILWFLLLLIVLSVGFQMANETTSVSVLDQMIIDEVK